MSTEKEPKLGTSMTEWSARLYEAGLPDIARAIDDDKIASLKRLQKLGLPQYRFAYTGLQKFLANPDAIFETLDLEQYFVALSPTRDASLKRKRDFKLTKAEVYAFAEHSLKTEEQPAYDLVLQEFFPHYYGGNVICDRSGYVLLELVKGELGHNDLVTSRKNADLTMERNPLTGLFSLQTTFGELEPDLPKALWNTILSVPHLTEGEHSAEYAVRGLTFLPGYYEFYLDRRDENSSLEPFFIDSSAQAAFRFQS